MAATNKENQAALMRLDSGLQDALSRIKAVLNRQADLAKSHLYALQMMLAIQYRSVHYEEHLLAAATPIHHPTLVAEEQHPIDDEEYATVIGDFRSP